MQVFIALVICFAVSKSQTGSMLLVEPIDT